MSLTDGAALDALADALTIEAFDHFRWAARAAELPLAVINAFASYRTAVDFTARAHVARACGNEVEATSLAAWARGALAEMDAELMRLCGAQYDPRNYPAH